HWQNRCPGANRSSPGRRTAQRARLAATADETATGAANSRTASVRSPVVTPREREGGDLFGHKPDKEYDDGGAQEERAHVREPSGRCEGVGVVAQASKREGDRNGQEELQGRI